MPKTYKDYSTIFQITKIEEDKYILLSVLTKKQLGTLMEDLYKDYEERANSWRGQFQALAKAIVSAYQKFQQN